MTGIYPQPFNARLTVAYKSPKGATISMKVFDITGRQVERLKQVSRTDGGQSMSIAATDWRSGVYFLTADDGTLTFTRKAVLLK